jgi:predicted SAM-dependent methyltransferase
MVGEHGSEAGVVCTAKYKAEMHDLPFQRSQFDILVARHVLEHDPDTLTVLNEWHRVLRPGGVLVVICPDQQDYAWNTIHLDPTHRACFTRNQLAALARHAGFEGIGVGAALPQWSFFLLARKPGPASWEDVMTNFYKYQIKS